MNIGKNNIFESDKGNSEIDLNKDILLNIVQLSCKEVDGVAEFSPRFFGQLKKIFNSAYEDGIKIKTTSEGLIIDIFIEIEYGKNINEIVYKVQRNIKNNVSSMLDINVRQINVSIIDVMIGKEENDG